MSTRRQLLMLAERYLEALASNAPGSLPLAEQVRCTVDGVPAPLGSAEVWGSAVRIPARQTFVDADSSQIVFFGVLSNSTSQHASLRNTDWFLAVRIAVVDELITEVEEITFEGTWAHYSMQPSLVEMDPRFEGMLPAEERSTRDEMVAIVTAYCAAVARTGRPASAVPFHPDARRTELGQVTTDSWNFPRTPRGDFDNDGWRWKVANLRFPVFDLARGVVVAIFALQLDAESNPDFSPTLVVEAFKVEDGLIRRMFAIYHAGSADDGWGSV